MSDAALLASETRYRRLFESAKDGILILDGESGTIIDVNPFLAAILGYPQKHFVGKQVWQLGFLKDVVPNHDKFLELQAREYIRYEDLPLETAFGGTVDVEFVSNVYLVNGKKVIQCNIRDITERKKAKRDLQHYYDHIEELVVLRTEELEKAKQEAVAANQAKSLFLSSMSHEIRTPLNAILGFSELMLQDPKLSPENHVHLETINRSGEHLLTLINEILDFAKIEAGKVSVHSLVFNLHFLLKDLTRLFRVEVEAKGLSLKLELSEDLPEFIATDEGKLRQILINVVGNAVKFTRQGKIVVRIRHEPQEDRTAKLIFEVEDTGAGILDADRGKVFGLFEQTTDGAHAGGSGLGLALSQQYARLLGGDIEMVSRVGKGSCFTVTILVMEAHPSEAISHQRNPRVKHLIAGTTAPRVLVVDDETDNRILMREFLVPVGFLVDLAEDGRVAVKKFKVGRPDLILMDVKMPVMGGERAIRAIRALKHGDEVKIIAVTASAFVEDRQKVLDWGADGYLRKPYKESELFEVIGKVLGTRYEYQPLEPAPEESHLLVAGSLGALPADLVSRMRTAAENIDYEGLEELIGIAATFSPVLAGRLLELLKRYEYETLGTLFAVRDGPLV